MIYLTTAAPLKIHQRIKLPVLKGVKRVFRFLRIYGFRRTLYKVLARGRFDIGPLRPSAASRRNIGMLGCGQFGFATIGCILVGSRGNEFIDCFDPNDRAQQTFARFFRIANPSQSGSDLLSNPAVQLVYVASNHASHASYAIAALNAGKSVYIEKPIVVTWDQASQLFEVVRRHPGRAFAGYNRPFSAAIRQVRQAAQGLQGPISLSCTVIGHVLEPDHWYRNPDEGTRICGNVGHWIDLAVHALRWSSNPRTFTIAICYSDLSSSDDNISISLSTPRGDLVSIVLSSRGEPFEGINETIIFQQASLISKINDFREMHLWEGDRLRRFIFRPKDVGHIHAILQPFSSPSRDWTEVEISTIIMLFITDMVRNGDMVGRLDIDACYRRIGIQSEL